MYEKSAADCWWYNEDTSKHAQVAFLATFPDGYTPKVDTRGPKQIEADAAANGWW